MEHIANQLGAAYERHLNGDDGRGDVSRRSVAPAYSRILRLLKRSHAQLAIVHHWCVSLIGRERDDTLADRCTRIGCTRI